MKLSWRKLLAGCWLLTILVFCAGCQSEENIQRGNVVNDWILDDPDGLHPYNTIDALSTFIANNVFQRLLSYDFETHQLVPVLAKEKPVISVESDSLMTLTYELREDASWDNGEPVTARDAAFSFKAAMAPGVDDAQLKPYLSFISDIELHEDNDRKFTIVANQVHMRAEITASYEVYIIPRHIYDPDDLLGKYTYSQLIGIDSLNNYPDLQKFADNFNHEKFIRDPQYIEGSGAYTFERWKNGQRIVLKRKEKWWGDDVSMNKNMFFEAYPEELRYIVISNQTGAVNALKAGELDIMRYVPPAIFTEEMQDNPGFREKFNLHTPPTYSWAYFGLNTKNPKLRNKKTRQALAHLVNYDRLINDLAEGFGTRITGPMSPQKKEYNDNIETYPYDIEKAKELLAEAGWENEDGDETLDKMIDGERTELEIRFLTVSGNEERQKAILVLKQDAAKAGVKINIQVIDPQILRKRLRNHEFEMYYGAWSTDPGPDDHRQLWHTEEALGGYNYTQFGNARSDSLIEAINLAVEEEEMIRLQLEFQDILHEETPYIFLWALENRLAIHKRFTNTHISAQRPGYYVAGFRLDEDFQPEENNNGNKQEQE